MQIKTIKLNVIFGLSWKKERLYLKVNSHRLTFRPHFHPHVQHYASVCVIHVCRYLHSRRSWAERSYIIKYNMTSFISLFSFNFCHAKIDTQQQPQDIFQNCTKYEYFSFHFRRFFANNFLRWFDIDSMMIILLKCRM